MDPDTALVYHHKNKITLMKRIGISAVLVFAIVGIALGVVYHVYPQAALKVINIAYEWRAGSNLSRWRSTDMRFPTTREAKARPWY